MVWARAALVGGLLLVVVAFAFGTEHQRSTVVSGQTYSCGPSISASWLVSGTPDMTTSDAIATSEDRRVVAGCRPVVRQSRTLILAAIGMGGLLALVGGTGVRRRHEAATSPTTLVHAGES